MRLPGMKAFEPTRRSPFGRLSESQSRPAWVSKRINMVIDTEVEGGCHCAQSTGTPGKVVAISNVVTSFIKGARPRYRSEGRQGLWFRSVRRACTLGPGGHTGHLMPHAAKATIMLQRRGSSFINGKAIRNGFKGSGYGARAPEPAPELLGPKGGKATGGNYSTEQSAQRLSATLSIRPRGRVQIIDI